MAIPSYVNVNFGDKHFSINKKVTSVVVNRIGAGVDDVESLN